MDVANCEKSTFDSVINNLLPVLIKGIKKNIDVELQQSYLNAFSTIVNKFGSSSADFANADISKVLIESLGTITTDRGLLNELPEIIIASINAITSIVNALGVKTLGLFLRLFHQLLRFGKPLPRRIVKSPSWCKVLC